MYIFCLCYILLSGLLHKETQRTLSTGGISCSFTAAKTLTPVEIPATAGTHSKLDARSKTPIAIRLMKICQLTQCCSMTALVLLRDDVEPNSGWNQPALNQLSGLKIAYLNIRSLSDHLDEFRILRWFETVFHFPFQLNFMKGVHVCGKRLLLLVDGRCNSNLSTNQLLYSH